MDDKSKGDKFPLLIYRHWSKMLRLPSMLIAIACGVMWWFAPDSPMLASRAWLFIVIGSIGALIYFYSLLAWKAAHIQCLPNYLKIRTPLLAVTISYKRVMQVRPIEFHSQLSLVDVRRTRRRLLYPFLDRTVILLGLNGFPVSERRLRTWLPSFMFASDVTGFVLVVEDWMALSRQISVYSDRWVASRRARQRPSIGRTY